MDFRRPNGFYSDLTTESYFWDIAQLQLSHDPCGPQASYGGSDAATSPLDHAAHHPRPDEIPNGPLSEYEDIMNYKGSTERYDGLPTQTLSPAPLLAYPEFAYDDLNVQRNCQTQSTPMAMNPPGHAGNHSAPDETLDGTPSRDTMDYETSAQERDNSPPAQAPQPPPAIPTRLGSKNKAVKVSPPEEYVSCGINCGGGFLGKHQCNGSTDKALIIKCLGKHRLRYPWESETEREGKFKFKTKNGYNRHFRSHHLEGDAKIANTFFCPVQGCMKAEGGYRGGFSRYDNLLQHRRKVHKHNIPKTHVTPKMKAPKPYARKPVDANRAGPSNESN